MGMFSVRYVKYVKLRCCFSALSPQKTSDAAEQSSGNNVSLPVPPGMSEYTFKRVTNETALKPEDLEKVCVYLKTINLNIF